MAHPAGTHRSQLRFFSSASDEERARRPTDVVLLVVVLALLVPLVAVVDPDQPTRLGSALTAVLDSLPSAFDDAWRVGYDAMLLWAVVLLVVPIVAGDRWALVRDVVLAAVLGYLAVVLVARVAGVDTPGLLSWLEDGPPAVFPASRMAMLTAMAVTASPHLSRPFRVLGRAVLAAGAVGGVWLQVARPVGLLAGFLLGVAVAAAVHLVRGSPGGRPTPSQIRAALAELGVAAGAVGAVTVGGDGAVRAAVDGDDGPLAVKVYGRDAWNGQLVTGLWRFLWYRDSGSVNTATRRQLVEHEGFVTLLAERAGAPVRHVLAAGVGATGDALLVARAGDAPLAMPGQGGAPPTPTPAGGDGAPAATAGPGDVGRPWLKEVWAGLDVLHGAGLAHGRLDGETVRVGVDGRPVFADLAAARIAPSRADLQGDRAQLVVLTAIVGGTDGAIAAARDALGDAALAGVVPFLQRAALPSTLRRAAKDADLDVDDLRKAVEAATGVEEPELEKLQRISWGAVLQLGLLALAVWMLVSGLSDLGLAAVVDELRGASWGWLLVGLLVAQTPRLAQGMSTIGASPQALPVGPVTALQFAISYINLAVPSTAARVAVTIRFFRRLGTTATAAVSIGALDSVAGFLVQVALVLVILLAGAGSLSFDVDVDQATVVRLLVLCGLLVVAGVAVVLVVPRLRARVVPMLREALGVLRVVQSPSKALLLFGGNLLAQVLFAVAILCTLRGFGTSAGLAELVLVNTLVTTFAGLLPVPGGIGVAEAGLTAGLVGLGVDEATAVAAAISYRFMSFYLPPIWGFFSFTWLQRNSYL